MVYSVSWEIALKFLDEYLYIRMNNSGKCQQKDTNSF